MTKALVPCPLCGKPPDRFRCGQENIEVIHCPRGCKAHAFSFVTHITSVLVDGGGWDDLGDAWNTIRLVTNENGMPMIQFDYYAPGKEPPPPAQSNRRIMK